MLWAHTYASVNNVSYCWVFTEIPPGAAGGFPWCIRLATTANWTWLTDQDFNISWFSVCQAIVNLSWWDHLSTHPFIGYTVWNGWGWLLGEQVELRDPEDRFVEQQ